LLLVELLKPAE